MLTSATNPGTSSPTVRRRHNRARVFLGGLLAGSTLAATIVVSDMSVFTGFAWWWLVAVVFATGFGLGLIPWRLPDALAAVAISLLVSVVVALALWTMPGADPLERAMFSGGSVRKLFFGLYWSLPLTLVGVLVARFFNPTPE